MDSAIDNYLELNAWKAQANCRGMGHLFFRPEDEKLQAAEPRERAAKKICAQCVVFSECLEYAWQNEEQGVLAGMTEEERIAAGMPVPQEVILRVYRREQAKRYRSKGRLSEKQSA
jgi:WhiB family transcriptional regulator, redox-sensing transcriptional regulator